MASLHNADLAKAQGATHVIDRMLPQDQIVEQVKAIVGDLVDLSYETVVEDETIALSAAAVKPGGAALVGRGALELHDEHVGHVAPVGLPRAAVARRREPFVDSECVLWGGVEGAVDA